MVFNKKQQLLFKLPSCSHTQIALFLFLEFCVRSFSFHDSARFLHDLIHNDDLEKLDACQNSLGLTVSNV